MYSTQQSTIEPIFIQRSDCCQLVAYPLLQRRVVDEQDDLDEQSPVTYMSHSIVKSLISSDSRVHHSGPLSFTRCAALDLHLIHACISRLYFTLIPRIPVALTVNVTANNTKSSPTTNATLSQ